MNEEVDRPSAARPAGRAPAGGDRAHHPSDIVIQEARIMFGSSAVDSRGVGVGRFLVRSLAAALAGGLFALTLLVIPLAPAQSLAPSRDRVPPKSTDNFTKSYVGAAAAVERGDVLDLEPAVAQAELILAVRLVDVAETKIVHGGRNVQITEQFRFEPVRVLKGIFAHESLLLTGQDLGIYRFADSADRLARGDLMLVLLGRQGQNYFNCNGAATLAQSIPRLKGKQDPLLPAVEVLIGMIRNRDRSDRVAHLRDGLKRASGRAVAPLLLSLSRRAVLAAQVPGVIDAILPHLTSDSAAIREVAAKTMGALLEADLSGRAARRGEAAKALVASLEASRPDVGARVAAIDALGALGAGSGKDGAAVAWLKGTRPATTLTETAARLRAIGKLAATDQKEEAARVYGGLALDSPVEVQSAAGAALARLDAPAAAALISSRLAAKQAAGLAVALEIELLGNLPAAVAAPQLLKAWGRTLGPNEALAFAQACSRVADGRLVSACAALLDPRQWQTRAFAVEALVKINSDEAASALWPHLDEEPDVARKLQLIAFLGRHGYRDGYAQAIEQLSQQALRNQAIEALAAIGEPRAIPELRRIWQTSNDLAWNGAAIRALARLGQADIAPKLMEIARVAGDPLAPSALVGLGYLGTPEALPIVRDALSSRSDELVITACRAAAGLLARPALASDGIRDRLAGLLSDVDASQPVRQAALEALVALDDPRLPRSLATVARDANLEGTPLLASVELELARRGAPARAGRD
jgi:HEAT repeat protein